MRKIIYAENKQDAPAEVWLEWSAVYDELGPHDHCLEDEFLYEPELAHSPVRYVREDLTPDTDRGKAP